MRGSATNMEVDKSPLTVKYSGKAIAGGLMDLDELLPALGALRLTMVSAAQELNHGVAEATVLIDAETRAGSYEFTLILAQAASQAHLFGSAIHSSFEITTLLFGDKGLVGLLKFLLGLDDKEVAQSELRDGSVQFTQKGIGNKTEVHVHNTFVVPPEVAKLYRRKDIRANLYPAIEPVTTAGIDKVSFSTATSTEQVTKEEAKAFVPAALPIVSHDDSFRVTEEVVNIVKASFDDNRRWKFRLGVDVFGAKMADMSFQRKVHRREILFGDGDKLRVELHARHYQDAAYTDYFIARVIEYIPGPKQLSF